MTKLSLIIDMINIGYLGAKHEKKTHYHDNKLHLSNQEKTKMT